MNDEVLEWLLGQVKPPGPGHRSESRAKARQKVGLQVIRRIGPDGMPPKEWTDAGPLVLEYEGHIVRMPGRQPPKR